MTNLVFLILVQSTFYFIKVFEVVVENVFVVTGSIGEAMPSTLGGLVDIKVVCVIRVSHRRRPEYIFSRRKLIKKERCERRKNYWKNRRQCNTSETKFNAYQNVLWIFLFSQINSLKKKSEKHHSFLGIG